MINKEQFNSFRIQNEWSNLNEWLEQYQNSLLDYIILGGGLIGINLAQIEIDILSVTYPQVLKKYQNILKSNLVSSTYTNKLILEELAGTISKSVSIVYYERIVKNMGAIEKIIHEVELNIDKYEKIAKGFPKQDRLSIIQKAAAEGSNWKGHKYSYKELNNLNKGINKYIENKSLQDKYELNHKDSLANNETPVKKEKMWVWSGLENTRHSGMDGQTVELKEKFIVTNEITGHVDDLLFPGDFENTNSCSNICNCQCGILYI